MALPKSFIADTPSSFTPDTPPSGGGSGQTFLETADKTLSNMPGLLGGAASGIYNAGKGLAQLGGSAVADLFHAVNHPVDSLSHVTSFLGDELKGGANPETLDTLGKFTQSTLGSKGLLGVAQLPGKVAFQAMHPDEQVTTPGQALGTAANAFLTALTFGEGNVAAEGIKGAVEQKLLSPSVAKVLTNAATSFTGRSLQSGALGAGFQAAGNLQEGRPVGENLSQGFFTGAALPGVAEGAGKVAGIATKTLPSVGDGAEILRKSIGFRGGNALEKKQFDNAVPVVYKELQKSGFSLDGPSGENLVAVDKAVDTHMTNLLAERTRRIEATGGDATINGDLAAAKIRGLVQHGSVDDLVNPGLTDRLDAIAKNFEGKQYSPVEAQKAIIQANSGFSFADNPAMGKQIKMAVSQAFTPELDRIVAGADEIRYDAKGKPIPQAGGTAELNKQWSAFKAFKDQLNKKITIEDRKVPTDINSRVTVPQAVGKVVEGVTNPLGTLGKVAGGSAEYLTNKFLGDRNNVNYRIYRAFHSSPVGEALVGMLDKFKTAQQLTELLRQNPLIQNVLEKVLPPEKQVTELPSPSSLTLPKEQGVIPKKLENIRSSDQLYHEYSQVQPTDATAQKLHDDLRGMYSFGASPETVQRAFDAVRMELEIAQPGSRYLVPTGDGQGSGYEARAEHSTFPKWVPEDLRRTALFEKVLQILDPEKIEYPSGNRPRLRELYNTVLDTLDEHMGVDTSEVRSEIMKQYAKSKKDSK